MPAVVKAPSPLVAQQWKRAWDVGRYVGKVVVTGTAASFTYLAYVEPVKSGSTRFKLLSLGAAIVGSIVPFTIISSYPFNEAINQRLSEIEGETSPNMQDNGKGDFKQLVVDWGRLDYYRALLAFAGTVAGLSAFLV